MESRSKKPAMKRRFSTAEKLKILREWDENPHMKRVDLASKLKLPPSTLHTIVTNRKKIERFAQMGLNLNRKKLRNFKFSQDLLAKRKETRSSSEVSLNGAVVRDKARKLSCKVGVSDFTASNGWIDRIKKRRGMTGCYVRGVTADTDVWERWKDVTLPSLIKDYNPNDVFNASEMGLFFNFLPSEILALKGDKCLRGSMSDDRLTALLCCNESGTERLMPLVIGKYNQPDCFKNARKFPCMYECDPNSWMTTTIFEKFLRILDIKMGGQNRKILLLIDNSAAHSVDTGSLRNVKVAFFPSKCSIVLQPLDQGIIRCVKRKFRELLVHERLVGIQIPGRKVNILEAMKFVKYAWDSVEPYAVRYCFRSSGFHRTTDGDDATFACHEAMQEQSIDAYDQLLEGQGMTFDEFVACDDDIAVCRSMQIDENSEQDEGDEEDEVEPKSPPTFEEAVNAMEVVRRFVISHKVDESVMSALIKMYSTIKVLGLASEK